MQRPQADYAPEAGWDGNLVMLVQQHLYASIHRPRARPSLMPKADVMRSGIRMIRPLARKDVAHVASFWLKCGEWC